mgnify:FL=1
MSLDFNQFLYTFDIIFLIVILISFIFGVKNGLIKSFLNVTKWILIFYIIKNCFIILRPIFDPYINNQTLSDILIFFTTLVVAYILITFLNRIIYGILQPKQSITINVIIGGVFGIFRGYIIFVLLVFFINNNFSYSPVTDFTKNGAFYEIVIYGVELLEQMPRSVNET